MCVITKFWDFLLSKLDLIELVSDSGYQFNLIREVGRRDVLDQMSHGYLISNTVLVCSLTDVC